MLTGEAKPVFGIEKAGEELGQQLQEKVPPMLSDDPYVQEEAEEALKFVPTSPAQLGLMYGMGQLAPEAVESGKAAVNAYLQRQRGQ